MKNIPLALLSFLLLFTTSESISAQFNLSVTGGINNSNYAYKNVENLSSENKTGYFLGVAPGYRFSEKFQLVVDFQYSIKGYNTGIDDPQLVSAFQFAYLDIIPEIEYRVFNNLAIGIGVNYGVKLNEQFRVQDNDWNDVSNRFELLKSVDFGLTGKVKANYKNLFGFIRYSLGLKDITDLVFTDENAQVIGDVELSSRVLQIGIGYTFDFGKN